MISELQDKQSKLQQARGQQRLLNEQLSDCRDKIRALKRLSRLTSMAQILIQEVARKTQEELSFRISDTVSLALSSVFNDPYKLELDFTTRRGKTECDIWFSRRGERVHPLTATGGGAVDVACFALRVVMLKLSQPSVRNVLILDEPFSKLSIDLQSKAQEMVKALSREVGLQIIMISHYADVTDFADKVFKFSLKKGVTVLT